MHIKMSCPFRVRSTISPIESLNWLNPLGWEFYGYTLARRWIQRQLADAKLSRELVVKMERNYLNGLVVAMARCWRCCFALL